MKKSARNAQIMYNGYNLSVNAYDYTISQTQEAIDVTGFQEGSQNFVPGVLTGEASVKFWWNSAANTVHDALGAPGLGILTINPDINQVQDFALTAEQTNYTPAGEMMGGAIKAGNIKFVNSVHNPMSWGVENGIKAYNGAISAAGETASVEDPDYVADATNHTVSLALHSYGPQSATSATFTGAAVTGTNVDDAGEVAWNNPELAETQDGTGIPNGTQGANADHDLSPGPTARVTDTLKVTIDANTDIPSGAIITGFGIAIRRGNPTAGSSSTTNDHTVQLMKSGSFVGTNQSSGALWANGAWETVQYGGATNLCGATTITADDIRAGNVAVGLKATMVRNTGFGYYAYVDAIRLTVYYYEGNFDLTLQYSLNGSSWVDGPASTGVGTDYSADYVTATAAYRPRYYRIKSAVATGTPGAISVYAHAGARKD